MTGSPRMIAAAMGGLILFVQLPAAQGQSARSPVRPVLSDAKFASLASGSIGGVVEDERGAPIPGAMVSALGAKTAITVTDRSGRFELRTLSPGPYLVRAHVTGFVGSRGQIIEVRASTRTASSIALRRATAMTTPAIPTANVPVLAASAGSLVEAVEAIESQTSAVSLPVALAPADSSASPVDPVERVDPVDPVDPVDRVGPVDPVDNVQTETAWRLRHLRRGILKDITVTD